MTTPKGNQHIWIVSGQVLIISSVLMILVRGPSCSSSSVCLFLDMVWSVYLWPVFLSCFADRFLIFCNCFLHVFSFPFLLLSFVSVLFYLHVICTFLTSQILNVFYYKASFQISSAYYFFSIIRGWFQISDCRCRPWITVEIDFLVWEEKMYLIFMRSCIFLPVTSFF